MKILLDTHALLWWIGGDKKMKIQVRNIIEAPATDILVSIASLWEILIKVRIGKLQADITEIERSIDKDGFILISITAAHLKMLATLPKLHRDPFDHILIAQAISEEAILVSDDRIVERYPVRILGKDSWSAT